MEDRKRSAGEDLAPPTKRQAVNCKASADADMPWSSDLEVCTWRHCQPDIPICPFEASSLDLTLCQPLVSAMERTIVPVVEY